MEISLGMSPPSQPEEGMTCHERLFPQPLKMLFCLFQWREIEQNTLHLSVYLDSVRFLKLKCVCCRGYSPCHKAAPANAGVQARLSFLVSIAPCLLQ